jgi:hypothetical protein
MKVERLSLEKTVKLIEPMLSEKQKATLVRKREGVGLSWVDEHGMY